MVPFIFATFGADAFNCPHCGAYARQTWYRTVGYDRHNAGMQVDAITLANCAHCGTPSIWLNKELLHPVTRQAPHVNSDMSADIQKIYNEAADIHSRSPRGAAALLRLCVQKLCIELGKLGNNINADIGSLVADGLPPEIIMALDVVRVIGNNAVHPGQIAMEESSEIVSALFTLVNAIADRMITQPRKIEALHSELPPGIQAAIARRDEQARTALPSPRKP